MKNNIEKYQYKTVNELKDEIPDYWILLLNPKYDKNFNLIGGNVVAKAKSKNAAWNKSDTIQGKNLKLTVYFSGKIQEPKNVVFCL